MKSILQLQKEMDERVEEIRVLRKDIAKVLITSQSTYNKSISNLLKFQFIKAYRLFKLSFDKHNELENLLVLLDVKVDLLQCLIDQLDSYKAN